MKAGKKIAAKAQKRGIHHANATREREKRGVSDHRGFKAPGSMNKKKTGA